MTRARTIFLIFGALIALALSWVLPRLHVPQDRFTVALNLIDDGRSADAVHLLEDRMWRGIAEYRANRFRRATAEFVQDASVTSIYNLGTSYARLGEWGAARAAYEKALSLDPGHEDAAFNLSLVLQAEERQRQEEEGQRETRTLGAEKGPARDGQREESAGGDQTTTENARPSDDATASERDANQAGQIAAEGRTGDVAKSEDAAAGRGTVTDSGEQDADGQQGAGGMRVLTQSKQNVEVLLRAIEDDPKRVLAARLMAIHRLRQEAGQ